MIDLNVGMSGRYKLAVQKNGETVRETGWFKNLITDQGMDLITTSNSAINACQVGSSSVAPAFSDVALGSLIAGVTSIIYAPTIDSTNRYSIISRTFTFSNGLAAGNIAEVGVGTAISGNTLFSRALVLDSMGQPTTITVLSDEDLVVIYQLWIKQPTEDFQSIVGGQTITIRSSGVDLSAGSEGKAWGTISGVGLHFIARKTFSTYTGEIGTITSSPTGTTSVTTNSTNDEYVAGSSTRVSRITWATNQSNFEIKSFSWGFGPTYWQAQLSAPITKNSSQTFRIGVRLTWTRDNGPA